MFVGLCVCVCVCVCASFWMYVVMCVCGRRNISFCVHVWARAFLGDIWWYVHVCSFLYRDWVFTRFSRFPSFPHLPFAVLLRCSVYAKLQIMVPHSDLSKHFLQRFLTLSARPVCKAILRLNKFHFKEANIRPNLFHGSTFPRFAIGVLDVSFICHFRGWHDAVLRNAVIYFNVGLGGRPPSSLLNLNDSN